MEDIFESPASVCVGVWEYMCVRVCVWVLEGVRCVTHLCQCVVLLSMIANDLSLL